MAHVFPNFLKMLTVQEIEKLGNHWYKCEFHVFNAVKWWNSPTSIWTGEEDSFLLASGWSEGFTVSVLAGVCQTGLGGLGWFCPRRKQLSDLSLPSRAWGQTEHFTHLFFSVIPFWEKIKSKDACLSWVFLLCFHAYVYILHTYTCIYALLGGKSILILVALLSVWLAEGNPSCPSGHLARSLGSCNQSTYQQDKTASFPIVGITAIKSCGLWVRRNCLASKKEHCVVCLCSVHRPSFLWALWRSKKPV